MGRRLVSRLHLLHRATAERLLLRHLLAADLTAANEQGLANFVPVPFDPIVRVKRSWLQLKL